MKEGAAKMSEDKGMIFDIQRSSFADGPGIRTAVFFKGCNLRCKWCHNPESQHAYPELMFHKNLCTGCGECASVCPNGFQSCTLCGACAEVCPQSAREICGREVTVSEVMDAILRDRAVYAATDGGVTFTGGECMLQVPLLYELAKRCKEAGIRTAVDTAGNVPRDSFETLLPVTDLFLYDIKAATPELHKEYTGVDNALILDNLAYLLDNGARVWVRIPLIHGVNDTEEEIGKIKALLHSRRIERIECLPYHAMGEHKNTALGRPFTSFAAPSKEETERIRAFLNT